jgi:hypothetical protein
LCPETSTKNAIQELHLRRAKWRPKIENIRKQFGVQELSVSDPDQHGFALVLVSWIQIRFCPFALDRNADPDPLHWKCGSGPGSALEMRIRIHEDKNDPQK